MLSKNIINQKAWIETQICQQSRGPALLFAAEYYDSRSTFRVHRRRESFTSLFSTHRSFQAGETALYCDDSQAQNSHQQLHHSVKNKFNSKKSSPPSLQKLWLLSEKVTEDKCSVHLPGLYCLDHRQLWTEWQPPNFASTGSFFPLWRHSEHNYCQTWAHLQADYE